MGDNQGNGKLSRIYALLFVALGHLSESVDACIYTRL